MTVDTTVTVSPQDADLMNTDPRIVTVWSDIGCPWATLALYTLQTRARQHDQLVLIDHRSFPLELFNRMPTPKFIVDAEMVTIAGCCPELGWRSWPGPDCAYPVTTLPAMAAVQAAKDPAIGGLVASAELDSALRAAFYSSGRCISMHSVIMDVAGECAHVDVDQLGAALARGVGTAAVFEQWGIAKRPEIQGSPQLFAAAGFTVHNPGATYHWTAAPLNGGFPRLDHYTPEWADGLLDRLRAAAPDQI
jgi:predicted DsbA family dithiol-disulfide isomerase